MKKVTFYYVRHGETLFNVLNRMQGWCDSPLTKKGIHDAEKAREALQTVPLKAAYVSTSERCRDTCAIILEGRDIPVYERKGLKEVNFGTWEAVEVDNHIEEINRRRGTGIHWDDCGGDSDESFAKRVRETYGGIYEERSHGDQILIVSHGAAWLWMQRILLGIDSGEYGRLRESKGLTKLPNGFNGVFSCTDGLWRLEQTPGLTSDEISRLYRSPGDIYSNR